MNLGIDKKVLDFEAGTTGPITDTDALFTSFGFASVSQIGTFGGTPDKFNTPIDGKGLVVSSFSGAIGLAIAEANPPSGSKSLTPELGAGWSFKLDGFALQFGFKIVEHDQVNITVQALLGGSLLDALNINSVTALDLLHFQSTTPFDEFRVLSNEAPDNGWGVDDVTLANISPIPEPAAMTVFLASFVMAATIGRKRAK